MLSRISLLGKFSLLATLVPLTALIISGAALNGTNALQYKYDNLYMNAGEGF